MAFSQPTASVAPSAGDEVSPSSRVISRVCMTPDKPAVYVLCGPQGDLLIDTGYRPSAYPLDLWLRKFDFDIRWIFLTHGHFDHCWNAFFLKKSHQAKVIMHRKDLEIYRNVECPDLFGSSLATRAIAKEAQLTTKKYKSPECGIDYLLGDNDTDFLRSLGFDADVIMLPGHTPGSMGVYCDGVLYAGDACSAKKGQYYTAMFGTDLDALFASEQKIFDLNPRVIAPGHGRLIENVNGLRKETFTDELHIGEETFSS